MFQVFDFASPDVSTEQRPRTTVPQQALFAMNSPFVLEQAQQSGGPSHARARRPNACGPCIAWRWRAIRRRKKSTSA